MKYGSYDNFFCLKCQIFFLKDQMIIQGDCLEKMREMMDNSIDFIVTDPPYGLYFMGKDWDGRVPAIEIWEEALRVCKPGAMLAAFGGSRTHHHLMLAIEGAGWEIRDVVMWLYGSGFPKSHNFGRKLGDEWEGYGTALKPAYEPIIIAMKPYDGTFVENARKWGVAGINVDAGRISHRNGRWPANIILDEEAAEMLDEQSGNIKGNCGIKGKFKGKRHCGQFAGGEISQEREYNFKEYHDSGGASRFFYCAKASPSERNRGLEGMPLKEAGIKNDSGRGFSESDPYKKILRQNNHPTVKPLSLMKYILKLLAPPNNPICLDPFAGSGTTLLAAKELGIRAIGIEKVPEYCEIANKRLIA